MPTLSQRVAPFLVMPNNAVAISSATPTVYSGTASATVAVPSRKCTNCAPSKYVWYGTRRLFHGLTLTFRVTDRGIGTLITGNG